MPRHTISVRSLRHQRMAVLYEGMSEEIAKTIAETATRAIAVTHGTGVVSARAGRKVVQEWDCQDGKAVPVEFSSEYR